ncbi:MAG TPA: hypothetical protein VF524_05725 [Polyangia bacterium]|jgi:hypothetical protein
MPDEPTTLPASTIPAVESRKASPYEMRPMVQVRRIALIEREVREYLSQAALDAVFDRSEVISEGETSTAQGKSAFLGSTMLTLDVSVLGEVLREPADEDTARRMAALLVDEPSLDARAQVIVRREVERITHGKPKSVRGETRIRVRGTRVYLDIDVEAALS